MTRPRLLFICHTLPYPTDGGVWLRTYNVLKLLATEYRITALCFERPRSAARHGKEAVAEGIEGPRPLVERIEVFELPQQHSRARLLWDHLRSVVRRRVYTTYLYESRAFARAIADTLLADTYDVVHVDSLDLSGYLHLLPLEKTVLVHHNVESQLFERRAAAEEGAWRRWYVGIQGRWMRETEATWCPRVRQNIAVSPNDRSAMEAIAPGSRFAVVPNGVDVEFFRPGTAEGGGIVFVGSASWFPNRYALLYFCQAILPLIRARVPDARVRWVGSSMPGDVEQIGKAYGVDLTGYVDDIRPIVLAAACYVVPLRVGGGSRLKILDAWAMGKAVVSTSIGCEGLAARHGDNIMVADTTETFADAVVRVLNEPGLRATLGAGARRTAEAEYAWEVIGRTMLPLYAVGAPSASAA